MDDSDRNCLTKFKYYRHVILEKIYVSSLLSTATLRLNLDHQNFSAKMTANASISQPNSKASAKAWSHFLDGGLSRQTQRRTTRGEQLGTCLLLPSQRTFEDAQHCPQWIERFLNDFINLD